MIDKEKLVKHIEDERQRQSDKWDNEWPDQHICADVALTELLAAIEAGEFAAAGD
jgi:hypothetical protein